MIVSKMKSGALIDKRLRDKSQTTAPLTPKLLSRTRTISKAFTNLTPPAFNLEYRQSQALVDRILGGLVPVRQQHNMATPKLIVFDLDYTLWPFWVDTHVSPPFRKEANGKVRDARNHQVKYYPDVPSILARLHSQGYKLGIASRTTTPRDGEELVRLFDWDKYFSYRQIFPDCKITHFKGLHKMSGIPYKDMLFFDDEHRNIEDVSTLGVTCMFVPDDGVNNSSLEEGLHLFADNNRSKSKDGAANS